MLDLRAIARDPEPTRTALARRRDGSEERLDAALALRARLNALRPELEEAQAKRNAGAKAIGDAKRTGADASEAIAEMQAVSARVKELQPEVDRLEAEFDELNASLPNPPDPTAADADTRCASGATCAPSGRDHLELAGAMIDMEAGSKVSGPRFAFLKGDLVFLELALVRWVLEVLRGHGFEPVIPPVLVKEQALFGTGFLPDTEQQIYRLADDPLYPHRAPPRCRSLRCTPARSWTRCRAATPGSRPASAVRRAPRARTRGASSASISSTRSRCSRSSSRPPLRRSTSGC